MKDSEEPEMLFVFTLVVWRMCEGFHFLA
jgi:hypothetical protein